jgi:hypothetical protein
MSYTLRRIRLELRAYTYALGDTRIDLRAWNYAHRVTRLELRAYMLFYFFPYFSKLFLIVEKLFGRFYGPVWALQYSQCFGEIVGPS